jgi:hypothetical protein
MPLVTRQDFVGVAKIIGMKCLNKGTWVIDDKHVSTPYEGRKRCKESDEDGRLYLCWVCETERKALAKRYALREARRNKRAGKG